MPSTSQDKPPSASPSKGKVTTTTNTTAAPSTIGGSTLDLEVAQACLNLRQESKATTTTAPPVPPPPHGTGASPHGSAPMQASEMAPPHGMGGTPSGNNGMDPKLYGASGPSMMNPVGGMGPPPGTMPLMGTHVGGDGTGSVAGRPGGPAAMAIPQVPTTYIGVPSQIEFSGPNAYYNNVVDNNGHFYAQFPSDDQYHVMMGGMGGAMREMSYYNMMGSGQGGAGPGGDASSNMMQAPNSTHFFPNTMMPAHDGGGHFNSMMGGYPQGGGGPGAGGYMQQKRAHPDEYSMPNDYKRSNNGSPHAKVEDTSMRTKKIEKKKGKRSSDMPRRPLSGYNFFFSEERERILAAIPDPATKNETGDDSSPNKANKENSKNDGNEDDKKDEFAELSKEEVHKKMAARSKRLLALREQHSNKRRPHRKTHGKIGFKELVKKIGERWRALPADQRDYYAGLADKDLKRYKEQMSEYNSKLTLNRNNPTVA